MNVMKKVLGILVVVTALAAVAAWVSTSFAYERYHDPAGGTQDECSRCHGIFDGPTSPQGSIFPSNDKHRMHRAASEMNTECNLCHTSGDGRNPYTGSSDGTPTNPGLGCTGCHMAEGLRLHHTNNGVTECAGCHTDGTPPPENTLPPYYGTADTNANDPCNPTEANKVNENWTVENPPQYVGLDNDGDNLYDQADPDCGTAEIPQEAGASGSLRVTAFDKGTGDITISYNVAGCSTDNTIEYGLLANVGSYTYSGQVCDIGNTGSATFQLPSDSYFFLVVADDDTAQGSYGVNNIGGTQSERPDNDADPNCTINQGDLGLGCTP